MTKEERKKAIEVLDDMKVKIDIPKAAKTQNDRNWALDVAIQALSQEPCTDAVSRQAILDGIDELKKSPWATDKRGNGFEYLITEALDVVADLCVKQLPSVTQKSGHWILADEQNKEDVENDNYRFICSECQCSDIHAKGTIVPYCWKCGAKMQESEEV